MKEKVKIVTYLLTRDETHLPSDYPDVDLRKLRRKNDLQRARLAKRLISEVITEMKETDTLFLTLN
jgi:hypothetical protein